MVTVPGKRQKNRYLISRGPFSVPIWAIKQPPAQLGLCIRALSSAPTVNLVHDSTAAIPDGIKCPRTNLTVAFLEVGHRDGIPVLCIVPSGNMRHVFLELHQYCTDNGIRLIVMNRPGNGGTSPCPLADRLEVSCSMYESVVEHLKIPKVVLLTLSGGVYYALHLALTRRRILTDKPLLIFSSVWVPSSVSSSALSYLPTFLIKAEHLLLPPALSLFMGSSALASSTTAAFTKQPSAAEPKARDDGLTTIPSGLSKEQEKTLRRLVRSEGFVGTSQEHMLCLEREAGAQYGEAWFRKQFEDMGALAPADRPILEVWTAADDGMVPRKGRVWMDDLGKRTLGDNYHSRETPGGHDILMVEERFGAIVSMLHERWPSLS